MYYFSKNIRHGKTISPLNVTFEEICNIFDHDTIQAFNQRLNVAIIQFKYSLTGVNRKR